MVQEVRKIILTSDELVIAYDNYRRVTPDFMPEGKIIYCKTSADGSVEVNIEIQTDNGPQQSQCVVRGMDVLKPLIRFCIENNIMLPRSGRKSISVVEGAAALNVALNLHVDLQDPHTLMRTSHITGLTEIFPKEIDTPSM